MKTPLAQISLAVFVTFCLLPSFVAGCAKKKPSATGGDFQSEMIAGKNAFENAKSEEAIDLWSKAVARQPTSPEAQLNLANAYLLAGNIPKTIAHAEEALRLSPNSASALYVLGCAYLREARHTDAIKALEQSRFIDPTVAATSFQLGQAHLGAGQVEAAAAAFREAVRLEPAHAAAHYALSQALMRTKDIDDAQNELATHQKITASRKGIVNDPTYFEKSVHTQALLPPMPPASPANPGPVVKFVDATADVFGDSTAAWRGPVAVFDPKRDGHPGLIVTDAEGQFRFLENQNGKLAATGKALPGLPAGVRGEILVGDVNNDHREDIVVMSSAGGKAFRLGEDGKLTDATEESKLGEVKATSAVLADFDVTGKLGLIAAAETGTVFYRNQGGGIFESAAGQLQLPDMKAGAPRDFWVDDWNGDDLPDIFVAIAGQPPQLLLNQRAGEFRNGAPDTPPLSPVSPAEPVSPKPAATWPIGSKLVCTSFNCGANFLSLFSTGSVCR
ncbi:MAG: tetratricopeptide repeat protein [Chthoniobacteraceae bacterium]